MVKVLVTIKKENREGETNRFNFSYDGEKKTLVGTRLAEFHTESMESAIKLIVLDELERITIEEVESHSSRPIRIN